MEGRKQEVHEFGGVVTEVNEFMQFFLDSDQSILFNIVSYLPVVIMLFTLV